MDAENFVEIVAAGRLTKISDNHNALRTNPVVGTFFRRPAIGESFVMIANPLDNKAAGFRLVSTSIVRSVESVSYGYIFETLNSTYELRLSSSGEIED